jgi:hypothetical protein
MKRLIGTAKSYAGAVAEKAKLRKGMLSIVAVISVFQLYFVRELAAAELLFVLAFAILLVVCALAYLIGTIGERGLDLTESGIRVLAESARRGYSSLDEISRKPFRHPRSESAQ